MTWQNSFTIAGEFRMKQRAFKRVELMKNVKIVLWANFGLPRLPLLFIKTLKMKQKTSATLQKTANATKTI